jgi:uncharacterized protein YgiM (DUF1202 family)
VEGLRLVEQDELLSLEPNLNPRALFALLVPSSGIVSPYELAFAMADDAAVNGVSFRFDEPVLQVKKESDGTFSVQTSKELYSCRVLINCAGASSADLHNQLSERKLAMVHRRGQYYLLDHAVTSPFKRTIFQCPSAMGKGVLVSPTVHGNILLGPSAEDISDPLDTATTKEGLDFVLEKARLTWPAATVRQNITNFSGVRAHLVTDDFVIGPVEGCDGAFEAAGIESPGLSSAPAVGESLAELVAAYLSLTRKDKVVPYQVPSKPFRTMTPAEQAEAAGAAEEAAAADTGAQAEGERSAVVSTSNGRLRVRSGPGADYDIVAYLNDGDTVTVLSVEGDWAKIRTADGQEGYTSAEYLIIEEAPAAEAATEAESEASAEAGTAAEQEAEGTAVISTESGRLRVRSGPGANYDIVAYLYNGDTVTVLSIDGDWAKIRTENGEEGYVSVSFLNMTESTESTETAAEEEEQEAAEPAEEEQQEAVEPAEEETADSGATEEISAAASRYSVYAGAVFDELNNVRAEAHEDGSYYYEDLTGDGMTVVNSAYAGRLTYQENAADGATGEAAAAEPADTSEEAAEGATENTDSISLVSAYLTSVLSGNGMTEISDMTVEKSETIEENIPDEAKAEAWTASWTMKADGSAKTCRGAVICTETFTYVYYLSVDSDQAEAAQEKCAEIINGLTLMDGEG